MSDPTQAQAEDRRAQIQARLLEIADYLQAQSWSIVVPAYGAEVREAVSELSRLSRELDAQIQESRRLLADRDAF